MKQVIQRPINFEAAVSKAPRRLRCARQVEQVGHSSTKLQRVFHRPLKIIPAHIAVLSSVYPS